MEKHCIKCNTVIPVLRVQALPGVRTCIDCSTETPKRGRIVTLGEGDHTYNELEILDQDTYRTVTELEISRGRASIQTYVELRDSEQPEFGDSLEDLKIPYIKQEEESEWEEFYEEEE